MLYWIINLDKNGIVTYLFEKFKMKLFREKPTGYWFWWLRYFWFVFSNWTETLLYSSNFHVCKEGQNRLDSFKASSPGCIPIVVFRIREPEVWYIYIYIYIIIIIIIIISSRPFHYVFELVCVWRNFLFYWPLC